MNDEIKIEPLPDDCFPPPHVVKKMLRGPELDADGKIVGGVYDGMTVDDVLRARDEYERACGD